MTDELVEAVRVFTRYDTKRDFGGKERETRREYNARFGQTVGPRFYVPSSFNYVWEWFRSLSARRRVSDGVPEPITHTEISAWAYNMRIVIREQEMVMLTEMDEAYIQASLIEYEASVARRQAKAPKAKRGK